MNNKEGLIQVSEELKIGLKTCDVKRLGDLILDDYKGFTLNGTIETKDDILVHFKPGGIKLSKYEVSEIEYEVFSDIGIVSGKGIIDGSYEGYNFHHQVLFIDIFKYVDDKWWYFKSQVTEIRND